MKLRHWFLVAVFAVLQGMAPLLHAHLGGDRDGPTGVHMHGGLAIGHAGTATFDVSHVAPDETPAIGVGQELRRKWSWTMPDLAALPVLPVPPLPAVAGRTGGPRLVSTLVAAPPHFTPPAQGPPRRA